MSANPRPEKAAFTLSYSFNAPREQVFNAFSNAEALNDWWGPAETNNSVVSIDFSPGGTFHFKMESKGGTSYGRFLFRTIRPHDLLIFSNAFADAAGNVVPAPFDIPLPKEILYTMHFSEANGQTTIHMTGEPLEGSDTEIAGFNQIRPDMQKGFSATFNNLSNYLSQ